MKKILFSLIVLLLISYSFLVVSIKFKQKESSEWHENLKEKHKEYLVARPNDPNHPILNWNQNNQPILNKIDFNILQRTEDSDITPNFQSIKNLSSNIQSSKLKDTLEKVKISEELEKQAMSIIASKSHYGCIEVNLSNSLCALNISYTLARYYYFHFLQNNLENKNIEANLYLDKILKIYRHINANSMNLVEAMIILQIKGQLLKIYYILEKDNKLLKKISALEKENIQPFLEYETLSKIYTMRFEAYQSVPVFLRIFWDFNETIKHEFEKLLVARAYIVNYKTNSTKEEKEYLKKETPWWQKLYLYNPMGAIMEHNDLGAQWPNRYIKKWFQYQKLTIN